jgi:hypothetical protein
MVRKATRRPTRTPSRSRKTSRPASRNTSAKPRRGSGEAHLTDLFTFLTKRLPDFIEEEFDRLDVARNESELFRELASLPDSTLRKAGLRREDLPRVVLSAFHLVDASKRRGKAKGRPPTKRAA